MPTYSHPDWLARNALRAYPLRSRAARVSARGFVLPDDLLVDLLAVFAGGGTPAPTGTFYLQSVCLTPALVSVVLAGIASGRSVVTASAPAGAAGGVAPGTCQAAALVAVPGSGAVSGRVVFGPALGSGRYESLLAQVGVGTHFFDSSNAFEARCELRTGPFPVRSLNGQNGQNAPAGSGDAVRVRLAGALRGAVSTLAGGAGQPDTQVLTLSLDDPAAFLSPCAAAAEAPCGDVRPPIRTVNGVRGDPQQGGKITVRFLGFSAQRQVAHSLRVLQLATGRDLCVKEPLPDDQGRLPIDYAADADPLTPY